MELQGDMGHVESHISPLGDGVSVGEGVRFVRNFPLAQKSFWTHLRVLLGDETQMEAHFGLFGDSANLEAR
jgi:hypothetical protein